MWWREKKAMESGHNILEYIKKRYNPLAVIVYGSYADGSNNLTSDFDALVLSRDHETIHDTSSVDGIELDVFVYPADALEGEIDCNDFVQIFDGRIVLDTDGRGAALQKRVLDYLDGLPRKTDAEIRASTGWCGKMLARSRRGDPEGFFRWHWVLTDSLEIFCDMAGHPYRGPKKALRWMEAAYPEGFALYRDALSGFTAESLEAWIDYLEKFQRKR